MANLNSENPHVGRKFQEFVQTILKEKYNTYFEQEAAIPIGRPPKEPSLILPMLTGLSWLNANVIRGLIPGMFRAQS